MTPQTKFKDQQYFTLLSTSTKIINIKTESAASPSAYGSKPTCHDARLAASLSTQD